MWGKKHMKRFTDTKDIATQLPRRTFLRGALATAITGASLGASTGSVAARHGTEITKPCFDVFTPINLGDTQWFLGIVEGTNPCFLPETVRLALTDDLLDLQGPILLSDEESTEESFDTRILDATIEAALDIGLGVASKHGGHVISDKEGEEQVNYHFPVDGLGLEVGPTDLTVFWEAPAAEGGGFFAITAADVIVHE
jgi:hypothetical protein